MAEKKWDLGYELYDKLNPPYQPAHIQRDGVYFRFIDDDNWLWVGYIPTPRTRIEWFFYNLIHGIWMRYPLWKVILFSLDGENQGRTTFGVDVVEEPKKLKEVKRYCTKCGRLFHHQNFVAKDFSLDGVTCKCGNAEWSTEKKKK